MVRRFLLFYLIRDEPKRIMYPIVDLLEKGQTTQSEFKYAGNERRFEAFSRIPFPIVA